jgi:hypothetical protein
MLIGGIWLLALVLLALWSAFAWMSYALMNMVVGLPWNEVVIQLKGLSVPAPFNEWWAFTVDLLGPVLEGMHGLLQVLLSFVGGALPVVVIVVWALGAFMLLALAVAGTLGVVWWKKNQASKLQPFKPQTLNPRL